MISIWSITTSRMSIPFALPVAMEADSVPIPNTQPPASAPFGWVGTSQTIERVCRQHSRVLSAPQSSLGSYFGGQSYPTYYAPSSVNTIKLPSGQNLFFQSPFNTGSNLSSFSFRPFGREPPALRADRWRLRSILDTRWGLHGPQYSQPNSNQLVLNHTTAADNTNLQLLASELSQYTFVATSSENGAIPAGTVVTQHAEGPDDTASIVGVNLSKPLSSADPSQYVYTFTRPPTDPIATAIASLWYSWANYYATTVPSIPATDVQGTVNSNILLLNNATLGLVPGMAVTDAQKHSHGVITAIASDNKTITLSQASSGAWPIPSVLPPRPSRQSRATTPTGLTPIKNVHVQRQSAALRQGIRPGIRAECVPGDEHDESHGHARDGECFDSPAG